MTVALKRPDADALLLTAKSIYISACASEITTAPDLFRRAPPVDATVTGVFTPAVNRDFCLDPEIGLRVRSFFLTRGLRPLLSAGLMEYCPWRYGMIDRWLSEAGRFDTALVMMSPPDRNGKCSFGVQADFFPSFHHKVERIVGFINPHMPRAAGHAQIDYKSLAAVVDHDVPLKNLALKAPDADASVIAEHIAQVVPDGATVQHGIGQIPSEAIAKLANHRGIRIHTGVVDDNVLLLEASGALDRDLPVVTGTAVGSAQLYDALADRKRFSMCPVSCTHSFKTISDIENFIAINSVLQIDLFGQVSAEGGSGKLIASPGGLPDFTRAALHSKGGKSIVAVRAKAVRGQARGVVAQLDAPHAVTNPAADADIVVTEFGVAHLRGASLDDRAEQLIAIADPGDRSELTTEWRETRSRIFTRSP